MLQASVFCADAKRQEDQSGGGGGGTLTFINPLLSLFQRCSIRSCPSSQELESVYFQR